MILLRWTCLALLLLSFTGCGNSGNDDNPAGAANRKERADRIEQYKAKAAPTSKPRR